MEKEQILHYLRITGEIIWLLLNLLAITCLLLAVCGMWIPPKHITTPALLGLGFEWLFLINIPFALSWLITKRKWWCVFGIVALVISIDGMLSTYNHHSAKKGDYAHELTILSYNTHQMEKSAKSDKNDILRYIKKSDADIVFLQEYEVRKDSKWLTFEEARDFLKKDYPYTYYDFSVYNKRRQYGLAVYSKYPLINKHSIHYDSKANGSNYCDAIVDGDTIRLFNNHLESNRFTRDDWQVEEDEDLKGSAQRVVDKMDVAYQRRVAEVKMVSEEIRKSPYPVIVAGDFNDVPVSYTYRKMSNGLQDCFLHSGWFGTGHTLIKHHLGIRIDYILTSKKFDVKSFKTDNKNYSDHQPITTTIAW